MLRGFLDNDSLFGQIMIRCWAIIICNLCFVITALPIVTAGAGWAAMDFALMNTLKNKNTAAPFRDFWKAFFTNFKQATISWVLSLAILAFLALDWYWCRQFGGFFDYIKIGILMIGAVIAVTLMYLFPTMAAFKATIPQLIGNSIYFMFKKPINLVMIVFVHVVPMALTYMDLQSTDGSDLYGSAETSALCLPVVFLWFCRSKPYYGQPSSGTIYAFS